MSMYFDTGRGEARVLPSPDEGHDVMHYVHVFKPAWGRAEFATAAPGKSLKRCGTVYQYANEGVRSRDLRAIAMAASSALVLENCPPTRTEIHVAPSSLATPAPIDISPDVCLWVRREPSVATTMPFAR